MSDNTSSFIIEEVGDVTARQYAGVFKVKTRLSHNDRFRADSLRRNMLGGLDPNTAGPQAQSMAEAFSQISVRIIDAPQWWKDSAGGTELADFNIISIIYNKCIEAENKAIEEVVKKAEAAKANLDKPIVKE